MNTTEQKIERLLLNLVSQQKSFAVYRLPFEEEIHFVTTQGVQPQLFKDLEELNGRDGFLISPFNIKGSHPIILINPEIQVVGQDCILEVLEEFCHTESKELKKEETSIASILDEATEFSVYKDAFDRFIKPLNKGEFDKLVLSRRHAIRRDANHSFFQSFIKAKHDYQAMMSYVCYTPQSGLWLGNTPEIILSGDNNKWLTVALAGTKSAEGLSSDDVLWDTKNVAEQEIVAQYIRKVLNADSETMSEEGPCTVQAGNVAHLKTEFNFTLKDNEKIGSLLNDLHPTPAICGFPKEKAFQFVTQNEGHDRKYYSGIIGMLDRAKRTDLFVNLRCAYIDDDSVTLYAGGGLMPTSSVEQEWDETNYKMQTLLKVL